MVAGVLSIDVLHYLIFSPIIQSFDQEARLKVESTKCASGERTYWIVG